MSPTVGRVVLWALVLLAALAVPCLLLFGVRQVSVTTPTSSARLPVSAETSVISSSDGLDTQLRECIAVIDGDTIELDGGERVRLIGVDTPELRLPGTGAEYFAIEAARFTDSLLAGCRVTLDYDETRHDRYGRTLAYVYRQDGIFVNAEIVRQGFGQAYTRFQFRHQDDFIRYESDARGSRRGLWAPRS